MKTQRPPEPEDPTDELVRRLESADPAALVAALASAPEPVLKQALRRFLRPRLAAMTPLQRHLKLFDRDGDGRLDWKETFAGFRDTGSPAPEAASTATNSHILMGFPSSGRPGDWRFSFERMHKARHPADTGLYADDLDEEERNRRIDALVAEYDGDGDGRLTQADLDRMVEANAAAEEESGRRGRLQRAFGRTASRLEFRALIERAGAPAADGSPSVDAQDLRDLYDGYLMYFLLRPERLAESVVQARGF